MASPLFECLNAVNLKSPGYKYKKKDCSGYMLLLWLSHSPSCMEYIDILNERLFDIPDELVYAALFKGIPKSKRYIKWDKGLKDKAMGKKKERIIQDLKDVHGMSDFEAKTLFKRYIDV